MIKAITFDLDGVYFPNGKSNFIIALGALGVSDEDARRVFLKSEQMNQLYKNGKMTDDEFWSWAASEWEIEKKPKELIKLLTDSYDVDENVVSVIKKVRSCGYKTLICSNNFAARVTSLQERFSFLDNFDTAVFSYEVGASKPSEAIFKALIKKSGVEAESIVFADDNPDNLDGAKQVGIHTFIYDGFDKFVGQLRSLGVNV